MITQKRLKELLSYDKNTGIFVWIKNSNSNNSSKNRLGKTAGCNSAGYKLILIDKRLYKAHRLAWLYEHGVFPEEDIDHVDGTKDNNAIDNLRVVSKAENSQNQRKARKDNKLGLLGVYFNKLTNTFRSRIMVKGKMIEIGSFSTAEEAYQAYLIAKRNLHITCTI